MEGRGGRMLWCAGSFRLSLISSRGAPPLSGHSMHFAHRGRLSHDLSLRTKSLYLGGSPLCRLCALPRGKHGGGLLLFYEAPNKNVADALINDRSLRQRLTLRNVTFVECSPFRYGSPRRRRGTARIRVAAVAPCVNKAR